MKVKFNSDDELLLNKTIGIPTIIILAKTVFRENKYYPQVFLDECLYKTKMKSKDELKEIDIKNRTIF